MPIKKCVLSKLHSSQITLKLVLAYGVSELVGFVQLPWHGNREARLVESTFGLLYDLVRSLRGVVIFFTYICKRTVLKRFRILIRPAKNVDEIVRCANAAIGVATRKSQIPPNSHRHQDHFNAMGKVNSEDTTNLSFHNQACTIDEEEKKSNESNEISPSENQIRSISGAFSIAKADLVMDPEKSLDTKSSVIERKEQEPIYV